MTEKLLFIFAAVLGALAIGGIMNTRRSKGYSRSILLVGCAGLLCAEGASLRGVAWDLPASSALSILAFLVVTRYRKDAADED